LVSDLLLEKIDAIQKRFRGRGTARDIDIDRDESIHSTHDVVTVVVVSSSIRATAHANDPFGIRHLVIEKS
jgi:hypothetical protein